MIYNLIMGDQDGKGEEDIDHATNYFDSIPLNKFILL